MGCCPTEAAAETAAFADAGRAARAGALAHAAREIRPGAALIRLVAPSMRCGACVATLERGLKGAPGVLNARANLTAKRLTVEFETETTSASAIAAQAEALGFDVHPAEDAEAAATAEAAETRDLLLRMGVAGFAAMNVMLLSVSVWSGADAATRDLMHWLSALIALPVMVYAGRPFFVSALAGLRRWRLNMDAPISLAVILAGAISIVETARGGPEAFFDAAVMLLFLLLVGRYLDRMMRARARSAANDLMKLQPAGATVIGPDGPAWTPLAAIEAGATVAVAPGERIAVDGEVLTGGSDVDASWLTGESAPEGVGPGDAVRAGALNLSGPLTLRAQAVGDASSLGAVAAMMAEAESRKSDVARLADRAAAIYAPVVHLAAALTFAGWLWAGADVREAAFIAIATLIITCPCALGLAAPMAQATAAGALFRRGVMLRDGAALERLAKVDAAVFDKTGTLTSGRARLRPPSGMAPADLAAAAALAAASRHPLAAALADWARGAGVAPATAADLRETPGAGVSGLIDGQPAKLGRAAWVEASDEAADQDASAVWLRVGDGPVRVFLFDDTLRDGAADTVAALAAQGMAVTVLSGDRPGPVARVAQAVGAADWRAQATPADKIAHVSALSDRGAKVLMVGDGVNDAPALAAASVSIAPAQAADVGRAAADIVFFGDDLRAVLDARDVAVRTRRVILQNFAIAACYNAIAIPIAVLGGASPLAAAIAMSTSSILVVANALRLNARGSLTRPAAAPTTAGGASMKAAAA